MIFQAGSRRGSVTPTLLQPSSVSAVASSSGVRLLDATNNPSLGTNGNGQGVDLSQRAAAMTNDGVSILNCSKKLSRNIKAKFTPKKVWVEP